MNSELVLALTFLAFGKFLTIGFFSALIRVPAVRRLRVYAIEPRSGQTRRELLSSWVVLTDPLVLFLLVQQGWIRFAPTTPGSVLLTFAILLVWVEISFYFGHRLEHHPRLFFIHRHHHQSLVTQPITSVSMSLVEKLLFYTIPWLGFMALVSFFVPISLWGILLYYSVYFFMSPLTHSNVELTPEWVQRLPFGLGAYLGSSSGHAMHHARPMGNFGIGTNLLDRWFGTYWPDTDAALARATRGDGLTRLSERANA